MTPGCQAWLEKEISMYQMLGVEMDSTPRACEYGLMWKVGLYGDQADMRSLELSVLHMAAVLLKGEGSLDAEIA